MIEGDQKIASWIKKKIWRNPTCEDKKSDKQERGRALNETEEEKLKRQVGGPVSPARDTEKQGGTDRILLGE